MFDNPAPPPMGAAIFIVTTMLVAVYIILRAGRHL